MLIPPLPPKKKPLRANWNGDPKGDPSVTGEKMGKPVQANARGEVPDGGHVVTVVVRGRRYYPKFEKPPTQGDLKDAADFYMKRDFPDDYKARQVVREQSIRRKELMAQGYSADDAMTVLTRDPHEQARVRERAEARMAGRPQTGIDAKYDDPAYRNARQLGKSDAEAQAARVAYHHDQAEVSTDAAVKNAVVAPVAKRLRDIGKGAEKAVVENNPLRNVPVVGPAVGSIASGIVTTPFQMADLALEPEQHVAGIGRVVAGTGTSEDKERALNDAMLALFPLGFEAGAAGAKAVGKAAFKRVVKGTAGPVADSLAGLAFKAAMPKEAKAATSLLRPTIRPVEGGERPSVPFRRVEPVAPDIAPRVEGVPAKAGPVPVPDGFEHTGRFDPRGAPILRAKKTAPPVETPPVEQPAVTPVEAPQAAIPKVGPEPVAAKVVKGEPKPGVGFEVRNEGTAATRDALGLEALAPPEKKTLLDMFEEGKRLNPTSIMMKVAKGRPLEDAEIGALGRHGAKLQERLESLPKDSPEFHDAVAEMDDLTRALNESGVKTARAFGARRMLVGLLGKNDYSVGAVASRVKKLSGAEVLSPETTARLEARVESAKSARQLEVETELRAANEQVARLQGRLEKTNGGSRLRGADRITRARQTRAEALAELESLRKSPGVSGRNRGAVDVGNPTKQIAALGKIGWTYVDEGLGSLEEVLKAVNVHAREHLGRDLNPQELAGAMREATRREPKVGPLTAAEQESFLRGERRKAVMKEARQATPKLGPKKPGGPSIEQRIEFYNKRIADAQEALRTKDYSKFGPQQRPVYDGPLADELARVRKAHDLALTQVRQEVANAKPATLADHALTYQRVAILSSPLVYLKLLGASLAHVPSELAADIFSRALDRLPAGNGKRLGEVAARSHIVPRDLAAGGKGVFSKQTLTDLKDMQLTHSDSMDHAAYARGDKLPMKGHGPIIDAIPNSHGTVKVPLKRYAHDEALTRRTRQAIRQGLNPDDPGVRAEIQAGAYNDALDAIFQGENLAADATSKMLGAIKRAKSGGAPLDNDGARVLASSAKSFVPIARVPFNYLGRNLQFTGLGLVESAFRYSKIMRLRGELTPVEAKVIQEAFGRGAVGTTITALVASKVISGPGYYRKGAKLKPDEHWGDIYIGGKKVDSHLTHGGAGGAINTWLTAFNAFQSAKGDSRGRGLGREPIDITGRVTTAVGETGLSLAEQTPVIGENLRIAQAAMRANGPSQVAGELVKGRVVPQAVQFAARKLDGDTKRKASGFVQTIQEGVPVARAKLKKRGR